MSDNVDGVDEQIIVRLYRVFNKEFDNKLREESFNFSFESIDGIHGVRESSQLVFTIVVEEEVSFRGMNTRFAETVIGAIFFGYFDKFRMIIELDVTVEITGSEDDLRRWINMFTRE